MFDDIKFLCNLDGGLLKVEMYTGTSDTYSVLQIFLDQYLISILLL